MDISLEWKDRVKRLLPDLEEGISLRFVSDVDYNYNCLSWALGCDTLLFENCKGAFWPWKQIPDDTAEGWATICQFHGYARTNSADFVLGYEKIAILQDEEGDLHACRQDKDGWWKSKLGVRGPDIDHAGLDALRAAYGTVVIVLEKRRLDWDTQ